ncbi:MAG: LPS export ABC transporter periplasmic protein LptC [Proteobacteria bacterium]|nr:MAG: LPS export ABC transporter periplasmic protein LptC [Pseudomonadota bacterium]
MKNLKNILFVSLLVFLFVEVLIIFPNRLEHKEEERAAKATADATQSQQPEQKMNGLHYVETQEQGGRDWEFFAEAAEGSIGTAAFDLKNVRVLFYNKEKVSFTVTGDRGSIDGKSKDLRIRGNVVTKSENGYTFKTPSIFYSSKKRQILSPEKVNMMGPADELGEGFELNGRNMLVTVDDDLMSIREGVRGSKKFKDGKAFQISSEKAEFSGKSRQAKFIDRVEMKYGTLNLTGPVATFHYRGNSSLINYVQMQGGVKVSDADKVATAETVNLDLLKNMFTFRGRPKVIQDNDELSGEEIVFLEGGKKVKVEKVRARMEKKE